jgi:Ni2+-binding GTPase involved in maturation of urease and hydrogenase
MSARTLKLPVPTTVVTGSLNSGKTTFISSLIKIKPQNAVWAVLVNEFGAVGLDRIALESAADAQGLHVKQIAGGCMCCVTGGVLALSIAQLLRAVKPDRLLIEPSGLGHPAGLIDALQGEHMKTALQLNAVVCLVSKIERQGLQQVPLSALGSCNWLSATPPRQTQQPPCCITCSAHLNTTSCMVTVWCAGVT